MSFKNYFLAFASCIPLVASCDKFAGTPVAAPEEALLSTKVVRLGDVYDSNSILFKLKKGSEASDIESLNAIGLSGLKKVFPSTPGKEELEARYGLDRWYEAELDGSVSLSNAVSKIAAIEEVSLVEYNAIAQKTSDCVLYQSSQEDVQTRANLNRNFNDPLLKEQWHYSNGGASAYGTNAVKGADINVSDVWAKLTAGNPSIIVAVVDEGVKYSHPDLAANMWKNPNETAGNNKDDDNNGYVDDVYGYNFVDDGPITWSLDGDSGHGTHTAGTVAAVNNNGIGVAGVAGGTGKNDGCRIMSCQIFSGKSGGTASVVAKAIKYAADMGASIISCSFGYTASMASDDAYIRNTGSLEIDAIHYFEDSKNNEAIDGGIAVFASGNDTHDYAHYPGAFYDIISVSALAADMLPTNYTNYGPGCNIAAPGGELGLASTFKSMVLSTVPSELTQMGTDSGMKKGYDYGYMQGTSMACPHVSGVVALGLSYALKQGKKFSRDEFKRMILASTNDIDQRISSVSKKSYQKCLITGSSQYYPAASDLQMAPYYHKMGTGAIDAWRLLMQIDGIPTSTAVIGKKQWIDLSDYFGSSSVSLTYLSVEVSEESAKSLGLQKISAVSDNKYPGLISDNAYAVVQYGRLYIHPTALGSGTITVKAVGGGSSLGGGSNPPGGMELSETISIVARDVDGGNGTGGWL